jgi:hypothetical protein
MIFIKKNRALCSNQIVYRAILNKNWIDSDRMKVLSDAYLPRQNGRDDRGLSVKIALRKSMVGLTKGAKSFAASFKKVYGIGLLVTRDVRKCDTRLNIIANPKKDMLCHALITGLKRSQSQADIEYLAGKLADITKIIHY